MDTLSETSDGGGELADTGNEQDDVMVFQNMSTVYNSTFVNPFSVLFYRSIFIVIYSVIFSVCIIGNVLVLFVTTKSAHMKTRTYFFLANLAVADLCVGLLCVLPNLLQFLYPGWLLGQAMCKLYYFAESFSFCASIMLLAVIAVERYIAVLHPLKAKGFFTKCRTHAMQTVIWVIAAAYNVPLLVIFDTVSFPAGNGTDAIVFCFVNQVINMRTYYTINFVVWYALPLLIMLFVYIVIAWTLWNSGSIFTSTTADTTSNGSGSKLIPATRDDRSGATSSSSGNSSVFSADGRSSQGVLRNGHAPRESKTSLCCAQSATANRGSCKRDEVSEINDNGGGQNPFGSMEIGLSGGPHSRPQTVYRNKNRILMCWTWASSNDTPKHENSLLTRSSPSTRSTIAQPHNYFELSCINSNNGHTHRHPKLRQNVLINQSNRRSLRNSSINFDMPSDSYNTSPPASLFNNKPRYLTTSMRVLSSRRKVVRLLVILLLVFSLCVLPHHVRLLMVYWDVYPTSSFAISFFPPISFICLYLNSALNPVLYSLFSESFRRSLRECARKPWQRWRSFISKPDILRRDRSGKNSNF